jgi:hypothetical protein
MFGVLAAGYLSLVTAACGTAPGETPGRNALPLAATALPDGNATSGHAQIDFARCVRGDGGAACFNAGAVRTASTIGAAVVAPGGPGNLIVSASGSTVFLSWTAPVSGDPVTSYIIEAGSAPGLVNLANFSTGNNLTSFSASGVGAGTYYVRIRAVNAGGTSIASNEATLVVGGTAGPCAGPPRNLMSISQSAGSVAFSWSPPSTGSPSSYTIEAGSSPGLANLANFDTGNPSTSFSTGGVGAGSYYVRVRSVSSCGSSAPSNEILIFVVGFTGDVQVSVSWDAPSDVDLHVIDPSGEEVYYGNSVSASGGQLDVDSNAACSIDGRQIENIRWASRAPGGTYTVRVDYWSSCAVAQTNFLVTVKNGASTQTFAGNFTGDGDRGAAGSGRTITSFFHAASALSERAMPMLRAPELFVPSPEKIRKGHVGARAF